MASNYLIGHRDVIPESQVEGSPEAYLYYDYGIEKPMIRLVTINNQPFVIVNDYNSDENGHMQFDIYGPLYSLIKEVSLKLNYSFELKCAYSQADIYSL